MQYHLPMGTGEAADTFAGLDPFTQGYIEAFFWTNANSADDEDLEGGTFAELAPSALADAVQDCADFREANATILAQAYERLDPPYDPNRAGVDFWLTRNGHGAGFWDRGLGSVGDELASAARIYGGRDLYRGDDGLIYFG
jgi:hypothetical protein